MKKVDKTKFNACIKADNDTGAMFFAWFTMMVMVLFGMLYFWPDKETVNPAGWFCFSLVASYFSGFGLTEALHRGIVWIKLAIF